MDDLLDLDFASGAQAPSKPSAQANYARGRTAFDYLAQPARTAPAPAPAAAPTPQTRPLKPPTKPATGAGGDAFAELFGGDSTTNARSPNSGASMAERLQKESAAKLAAYGAPAQRSGSSTPSDPWDLDLLAAAVPARKSSPLAAVNDHSPIDDPFDLGFDGPPATSSAPPASSAPVGDTAPADDFDLLDALASPAPGPSRTAGKQTFQPAAAPARTASPADSNARKSASSPVPPRSSSPPPHIVGQFVEMGFAPAAASAALAATASPSTGEWSLDAALEVLAEEQQVEERRRAKQREADEWGDEDEVRIGRRRSWQFDDEDASAGGRRPVAVPSAGPARRSPAPDSADAAPPTRRTRDIGLPERNGSSPAPADAAARDQADALKEQANEVLAQAQKFGLNMFKSANAYWGEGKKALQKALEEQRAAAARAGSGAADGRTGPPNGKPKWWREGMDDPEDPEVVESVRGKGKGRAAEPPAQEGGFMDSDDEDEGPETATRRPVPASSQRGSPNPRGAEPADSGGYRSPFRRGGKSSAPVEADLLAGGSAPPAASLRAPQASRRSPTASTSPSPSPSPAPTPRRAVAPPRSPVNVSASALASAAKHRATGNEHFKLGRFGEATAAFTLALDTLPETWLGNVPLLNNRAQARLKSGEEKQAAEDCTSALAILLAPVGGQVDLAALEAESTSLPAEVTQLFAGGSAINLRDQLGKALARRAKAYEANEKWPLASEDWQKLRTLGDETVTRGAGGIKMISDGVARCRQMLDGPRKPAAAPARTTASAGPARASPSAGRPPRPTKTLPVQGSGEAVRALQAQQVASAAEDDQRLQLKDKVDAQIAGWKGGKESNLRALIASLDAVLWPSLGWKTVGMHELISESQLKVRYVRAIAKVHPDKLNAQNTTLEQRMIAALVFAALNDAWNGMKS
ncbi:auxilin-like clathrin-binding protein required for normal clathrin function [Rhodotorula sphaerocarpa]